MAEIAHPAALRQQPTVPSDDRARAGEAAPAAFTTMLKDGLKDVEQ